MRWLIFIGAASASMVCGCAATMGTDGPIKTGPDTYMIGRLGHFNDFSGSAVKASIVSEAAAFCGGRSSEVQVIESSSRDSAPLAYASAEVHFRCIPRQPS